MKYRRILLKLSGEILGKEGTGGLAPSRVCYIVNEIQQAHKKGCQIAIVVGGGNLWRGAQAQQLGIETTTADQMGMLATIINALALQSALQRAGTPTVTMSRLELPAFCERYHILRARGHLEQGKVLLLGGGTANTVFTTDTAASLSAIELETDLLVKATKVEGIYSQDPQLHKGATLYKTLSFQEAITQNIQVLDGAALHLCRQRSIPLIVYNAAKAGHLSALIDGAAIGTLVTP